jgi:hypothetical protein
LLSKEREQLRAPPSVNSATREARGALRNGRRDASGSRTAMQFVVPADGLTSLFPAGAESVWPEYSWPYGQLVLLFEEPFMKVADADALRTIGWRGSRQGRVVGRVLSARSSGHGSLSTHASTCVCSVAAWRNSTPLWASGVRFLARDSDGMHSHAIHSDLC